MKKISFYLKPITVVINILIMIKIDIETILRLKLYYLKSINIY